MKATISLIDLVNALEATGPGLAWRVDLVTGDLIHCDDDAAPSERFRLLPANGALREDEIRREFCAALKDETLREQLAGSVETPAFLTHVRRAHVFDDYIVHRRAHLANLALEWAEAEDVACRRDLSPASLASN